MRVMKRIPGALIGLLAIVLSAAQPSFSQAVIENPAKPKAANAGRVVAPQEVLAISDEGTSDYYFKWPHALAAGPDGGLLLTDDRSGPVVRRGRPVPRQPLQEGAGARRDAVDGDSRRGGKGRCRLRRVPGQAGLFRRRGKVRKGDRRPGGGAERAEPDRLSPGPVPFRGSRVPPRVGRPGLRGQSPDDLRRERSRRPGGAAGDLRDPGLGRDGAAAAAGCSTSRA